jgi:type II secretory pathway pseudopilin PulG
MYTNEGMRANDPEFEIKAACYTPQTPEEQARGLSLLLPLGDRGGYVFVLAYTRRENSDSEVFYQALSEQTHQLVESFGKDSNPQHRFEQFLGTLNETLAEHVRNGAWNIPITDVHAIIGITSNKEMFLTGTGELTALFLHKKTQNRFQVFNLFRGIQTEQSLPTWEKVFAVVLDGDLHAGDVFCLTNKDIQSTIEQDELNNILSTLPPTGSVEKIRQYFGHRDHMQIIALRMTPLQTEPVQQAAKAPTNVSIEKLNETEDYTDHLLDDQKPSLRVFAKRAIAYIKAQSGRTESRILKDLQGQGSTWDIAKRLFRNALKATLLLGKQINRRVKHVVKKNEAQEQHSHIAHGARKEPLTIKDHLTNLFTKAATANNTTTYLIGGIIIAVVVLVVGITSISRSQARSAAETAYQEQLSTIEDVIERAASAVIYRDDDQARSLYVNAQTLVEQLPKETEEQIETADKFQNQVQTALNDLSNLVTIPNPPLLADLNSISDGVFGSTLIQNTNGIFVTGTNGNLYTYDTNQKQFTASIATADTFNAIASSSEDARMYAIDENGQLARLNTTSESIDYTEVSNTNWVDLEAYASRIYLLQRASADQDGQVVRYNISGANTTEETNWISSRTVSLENAVSLAVDGTVFILMSDGSIARFASGGEVGWDAGLVEPPITDATRIWTDSDSDFVYVLEPDTERIIVYEKESGDFVVQYRSDAFENLTDFIVDENDYTIYLLADTRLYSIAASHLE